MTASSAPPEPAPRRERRRSFRLHTRLDLYVLLRFGVLYAGTLASFTLVYVLIDLFENLSEFDDRTETWTGLLGLAARFYMAVVPVVFCQLLGPVVALTAGLFTVTLFHRSNELVPMLANGRPYWRIVAPIVVAGAAVSAGTFLVQELWIPRTADTITEVSGVREGHTVLYNQAYHDFEEGVLVLLDSYDVVERRAEGVQVVDLPGQARRGPGEREHFIRARGMEWVEQELEGEGYWLLLHGQIQAYDPNRRGGPSLVPPPYDGPPGAPRPLSERFVERPLESTLIPEDLESEDEAEIYMRLADLRRKMRTSIDRRWAIKYWSRFTTPLAALILLLVGLPVIAHWASRNIFFGVLVSAGTAAGFILASSAAANLALRGFLPAAFGVWIVPCFFAAVGLTWLRYSRL